MSARSFTLNKKSGAKQSNIVVYKYDDGSIIVNLHGHTVAAKNALGEITLSSCGYYTNTTKTAINRFLTLMGLSFGVMQKKGEWFLVGEGSKVNFVDGMKIPSSPLERLL
jgi:hypothetical protein